MDRKSYKDKLNSLYNQRFKVASQQPKSLLLMIPPIFSELSQYYITICTSRTFSLPFTTVIPHSRNGEEEEEEEVVAVHQEVLSLVLCQMENPKFSRIE